MRISELVQVTMVAAATAICVGCNGGGGGGGGGGGSTDGGGGGGAGGGGGNGNGGSSGGCALASTFQGQPGSLWVEGDAGKLTVFDTKDGRVLHDYPGVGVTNGLVGGKGFVLLYNVNGDRDLTPIDAASGQALAKLGIDPGELPVFANGNVWAYGVDTNALGVVYSIASPTSVTNLGTNITINGFTAGSEGAFFMGPTPSAIFAPDVAHSDSANTSIVWTIPHGTDAAFESTVKAGGPAQLFAVPGTLYVAIPSASGNDVFPIDTATHTIGSSIKVTVDDPADSLFFMTDGTSLFAYNAYTSNLVEVDKTTLAVKRTLDTQDSYIDYPLVAAGAIWLGKNCGGETYLRRVDIATFTMADILFPNGKGNAPGGYAFVPP